MDDQEPQSSNVLGVHWTVRYQNAGVFTIGEDGPIDHGDPVDLIPRQPRRFLFRYKATAAAIQALLDGAVQVTIDRHPSL